MEEEERRAALPNLREEAMVKAGMCMRERKTLDEEVIGKMSDLVVLRMFWRRRGEEERRKEEGKDRKSSYYYSFSRNIFLQYRLQGCN